MTSLTRPLPGGAVIPPFPDNPRAHTVEVGNDEVE